MTNPEQAQQMHTQLADLMVMLLDNSCSNPWFPDGYFKPSFDYQRELEAQDRRLGVRKGYLVNPEGWNVYEIELCCGKIRVVARKLNGLWEIKEWTLDA